jgi:hypothetical protein
MGNSVANVKAFCMYLESLKRAENYSTIFGELQKDKHFKSVWANVSAESNLFRCRPHQVDEENILFDNSSKIGYNRDTKIIKYGRCNKPEQPVLYLSENRDTAIIETLHERCVNDQCVITLGIWQPIKTIDVLYVVQPYKAKRGHQYEDQLGERYDQAVLRMKDKFPDYEQFMAIYFDYFDQKFKSEERGLSYQISAAYANMAYDAIGKEGKSYGIMYRSITQDDFFNVAFSQKVEDEKLIFLKDAFKLKLKVKKTNPVSFDDFEILTIAKAQAVSSDGTITW